MEKRHSEIAGVLRLCWLSEHLGVDYNAAIKIHSGIMDLCNYTHFPYNEARNNVIKALDEFKIN